MKLSSLPRVNDEDILEHYGVKGMRWGVRRTDAQLNRAAKARKSETGDKKPSGESKSGTKTSTDKVSASSLSDAQLRKKIERINMENQYAKLTEKPSVLSKGKSFATKAVAQAASQVVTQSLNSAVKKQYGDTIEKAFLKGFAKLPGSN